MERRFGEARQSHVRNGGTASAQYDIRRRTGHDNVKARRPRGVPQADVSDTDAHGWPVELGKTDFLPRHVQSSLVKHVNVLNEYKTVSKDQTRIVVWCTCSCRTHQTNTKRGTSVFYIRIFCVINNNVTVMIIITYRLVHRPSAAKSKSRDSYLFFKFKRTKDER